MINAVGKTSILELAALLERCDLLITNDTGPMHISVGIGTSVVALFGPSDHEVFGPYGKEHKVIQKQELDCVPCGNHTARNHECDRNHECMKEITVKEVLRAIEERL